MSNIGARKHYRNAAKPGRETNRSAHLAARPRFRVTQDDASVKEGAAQAAPTVACTRARRSATAAAPVTATPAANDIGCIQLT